jgi:hypothetical protein
MRKLVVAGLVLAALLSSAMVLAAPAPPSGGQGMGRHMGPPANHVGGVVVSISRDRAGHLLSFVVKTREGKSVTVKVTPKTQYSAGFQKSSPSCVKPKAFVGVQITKAGVYTADRVMVRGTEEFLGGAVQSVKTANGRLASFVVKNREGKLVTITVTSKTKYFSGQQATTAKIVKKGANLGAMVAKRGSTQALSVMAMPAGMGRGGPGGMGPGGHGGPGPAGGHGGGGWGDGRPK